MISKSTSRSAMILLALALLGVFVAAQTYVAPTVQIEYRTSEWDPIADDFIHTWHTFDPSGAPDGYLVFNHAVDARVCVYYPLSVSVSSIPNFGTFTLQTSPATPDETPLVFNFDPLSSNPNLVEHTDTPTCQYYYSNGHTLFDTYNLVGSIASNPLQTTFSWTSADIIMQPHCFVTPFPADPNGLQDTCENGGVCTPAEFHPDGYEGCVCPPLLEGDSCVYIANPPDLSTCITFEYSPGTGQPFALLTSSQTTSSTAGASIRAVIAPGCIGLDMKELASSIDFTITLDSYRRKYSRILSTTPIPNTAIIYLTIPLDRIGQPHLQVSYTPKSIYSAIAWMPMLDPHWSYDIIVL